MGTQSLVWDTIQPTREHVSQLNFFYLSSLALLSLVTKLSQVLSSMVEGKKMYFASSFMVFSQQCCDTAIYLYFFLLFVLILD